MLDERGLARRSWGMATMIAGWAMVAVYVTLVVGEGNNSFADILPWVVLMTVAAGMASGSMWAREEQLARRLMIAAAAIFAVLGVLSLFSIGLGFLATAGLATAASLGSRGVQTDLPA